MNKKTWIILAIVIVLLVGLGIFFYIRNQNVETDKRSL